MAMMTIVLAVPSSAFGVLQFHVVTLYENANATDVTNVPESNDVAAALTLFSNLNPAFTNPGYTFTGWNTGANGSGVAYSNGATYDFTAGSTSLYAQWKVNSATFYENSSGSDTTNASQLASTSTSLTQFANLNPTFSNPGYSFAGWTTGANGSGASFGNGATYDFTLGSIALYAQWTASVDTVTFVGNGGTVSPTAEIFSTGANPLTLPTPTYANNTFSGWYTALQGGVLIGASGSSYSPSSSVTLYAQWSLNPNFVVSFVTNGAAGSIPALQGFVGSSATIPSGSTLTQIGATFSGWNSLANGTGTSYLAGSQISPTGSLTLYAQWTLMPTFNVNFVTNGGTGSVLALDGLVGTPVTLPNGSTLLREGFTFNGWNSSANGSGTSYASGTQFIPSGPVVLYAQWTLIPTFNVNFVTNGGTGSVLALDGLVGTPVTLPNGSTLLREGFTFNGWNSSANGSGTSYASGTPFTPTGPVSLYAQWLNLPTFTVHFNVNGGHGSLTSMSGPAGSSVRLPAITSLMNPGFTFVSWNTMANGKGTSFRAGDPLTIKTAVVLYAQWSGHSPAFMIGAVGPFQPYGSSLSTGMKSQIRRFVAQIKTHRYTVVTLYGYTTNSGSTQRKRLTSLLRANAVASYLRWSLNSQHVLHVMIRAAGEGAIQGLDGATARRVEVFVK